MNDVEVLQAIKSRFHDVATAEVNVEPIGGPVDPLTGGVDELIDQFAAKTIDDSTSYKIGALTEAARLIKLAEAVNGAGPIPTGLCPRTGLTLDGSAGTVLRTFGYEAATMVHPQDFGSEATTGAGLMLDIASDRFSQVAKAAVTVTPTIEACKTKKRRGPFAKSTGRPDDRHQVRVGVVHVGSSVQRFEEWYASVDSNEYIACVDDVRTDATHTVVTVSGFDRAKIVAERIIEWQTAQHGALMLEGIES